MHINKRTEREFEKFKKSPIDTLRNFRRDLDEELMRNKVNVAWLDTPVPMHFNNVILTKNQEKRLFQSSKIVLGAIEKIAEEYYKSKELRKLLGVDSFEEEVFLNSPKQKGFGIMRLDAFFDGEEIKFVELNSDYPDGVIMLQNAWSSYSKFASKYGLLDKGEIKRIDSNKQFYANLMALYRINGGKRRLPTIAVLAPKGRAGDNEYFLMVEFLKNKGHKAFHVEPKDIKKGKDGFLYYKKEKIDMVRRAAEIRYFKTQKNRKIIFDAYKNKKAVFINGFHDRLLGIKSLFAILHNENYQHLFTKKEKRVIKETIPKTFIIPINKNEIKKQEYWKKKEKFVLKPSDLSEAENVLFGKDLSVGKWHKLLCSKECGGWIVQELIKVKKREFVNLENGQKKIRKLFWDMNIYLMMNKKGKVVVGELMMSRSSNSPIVNVSKGGGMNFGLLLK